MMLVNFNILSQDYASFLLKSQDLWSPAEYLNYYKKPINIILESGMKILLLTYNVRWFDQL